jgi:hypothetical protein
MYYHPPGVVVVGPQPVVVEPPAVEVEPAAPEAAAEADPAIQQLVAPIALYPDPILAIVLPASTYPDQVQEANAWVQGNPNASPEDIDSQNWDPSIKGLAHYPTVLNYMASELDWTKSLGSAFSENQANVFEAIQDLRAEAKNNGNLTSTQYLDVVADGTTISIQPANPAVMYIPTYDPVLVYQGPYVMTWGPSFVVGPWLVEGVNWDGGAIFVGDWHGGWVYGDGGWRRDHYFHGYDHRWGHDDRWGRRPYVDRGHWANRHEMREHGGFRGVHRSEERGRAVHARNEEHARTHAAAVREHANTSARGGAKPGARSGAKPAAKPAAAKKKPEGK